MLIDLRDLTGFKFRIGYQFMTQTVHESEMLTKGFELSKVKTYFRKSEHTFGSWGGLPKVEVQNRKSGTTVVNPGQSPTTVEYLGRMSLIRAIFDDIHDNCRRWRLSSGILGIF